MYRWMMKNVLEIIAGIGLLKNYWTLLFCKTAFFLLNVFWLLLLSLNKYNLLLLGSFYFLVFSYSAASFDLTWHKKSHVLIIIYTKEGGPRVPLQLLLLQFRLLRLWSSAFSFVLYWTEIEKKGKQFYLMLHVNTHVLGFFSNHDKARMCVSM